MSTTSSFLGTLNDLLASSCVLTMPLYQRQYSWEVHQLEDLWNDIFYLETRKRYFFGTILLKGTSQRYDSEFPENCKLFEIIDGQQRLTTVLILIRAILDELQIMEAGQGKKWEEMEKTYFT